MLAACLIAASKAGVNSLTSSRTPAPSRAGTTAATAGRILEDDGTFSRVAFVPTSTVPVRSASRVTSRGVIRGRLDRYAH